jgi:uncharacterized delta-60 repeat protein
MIRGLTVSKLLRLLMLGSIGRLQIMKRMVTKSLMFTFMLSLYSCGGSGTGDAVLVADGVLDTDFQANLGTGFTGAVDSVAVDSTGSVYVAGRFTDFKGLGTANLVKLTSTGLVDSSFSIGTGFDDTVYVVAVDGSDNVYVGGNFTTYNGTATPRFAKLSPTGELDTTFNLFLLGGFQVGFVSSIAFAPGGSIYVGGSFTTFNGSTFARLVRLSSTGSLDTSFNTGIGFNLGVDALLASGTSIFAGGSFTSFGSSSAKRLANVSSDAVLNSTFNAAVATGFDATVRSLAIDASNNLYVGGAFTNFKSTSNTAHFVRLDSDGSLDATYTSTLPAGLNAEVTGLAIQDNGDLIVAGNFNGGLYRIDSDGAEDTEFTTNRGTGTNAQINTLLIQSNGRILVGGQFTSFNGTSVGGLIRLK